MRIKLRFTRRLASFDRRVELLKRGTDTAAKTEITMITINSSTNVNADRLDTQCNCDLQIPLLA